MKKNIYCLIILLILLTTNICYTKTIGNTLKNKTIFIDVGHGGKDGGAIVNEINEKDLNLEISLLLKEELIKKGAIVLITRDDDYDLSSPNIDRRKKSDFDNRIKMVNESNADIYLSIHNNYYTNKKYYGAQAFYTSNNKELASIIQKEFNKKLQSPLKEKQIDKTKYFYKRLNIPGVLIECGFLSNPKELELLQSKTYQKKIVNSIIEGLLVYFQ